MDFVIFFPTFFHSNELLLCLHFWIQKTHFLYLYSVLWEYHWLCITPVIVLMLLLVCITRGGGTMGYCKFTPYIYFLLKLKMPSSPFTKHSGTYSQKRHKSSMYPITYPFPLFNYVLTYVSIECIPRSQNHCLSQSSYACPKSKWSLFSGVNQ